MHERKTLAFSVKWRGQACIDKNNFALCLRIGNKFNTRAAWPPFGSFPGMPCKVWVNLSSSIMILCMQFIAISLAAIRQRVPPFPVKGRCYLYAGTAIMGQSAWIMIANNGSKSTDYQDIHTSAIASFACGIVWWKMDDDDTLNRKWPTLFVQFLQLLQICSVHSSAVDLLVVFCCGKMRKLARRRKAVLEVCFGEHMCADLRLLLSSQAHLCRPQSTERHVRECLLEIAKELRMKQSLARACKIIL